MGQMLNLVYTVCVELEADGSKGLDEDYMMNIFLSLDDILPPFKKYLKYIFEEKSLTLLTPAAKRTMCLPVMELLPNSFTLQD